MLKTPSEIIKDSWELYAKNWRKFLPFLILLLLPSLILSALGAISLYLEVYIPKSSVISNIIILAVFAASMLFVFWTSIALTRAMANANAGQPFDWKNVFSTSSSLIWPVLVASLLVGLIVLGGSLLLVIPGIIFAIWYNFTFYTVIFENAKGLGALRASKALVSGRWLAIFWRWLAPGIIFSALSFVIFYVLSFLIKLIPLPMFMQSAVVSAASSLVNIAVSPLLAGAALILYQSAKQNPAGQPVSAPPSQL